MENISYKIQNLVDEKYNFCIPACKLFADKPLFLLIDFESFYLVTISTGNQVCKVL